MMKRHLKQITNVVLMIRPSHFRCNEQTAVNNHFQTESSLGHIEITKSAQAEFDNFTTVLRDAGITVLDVQDDDQYDTPDSVFPNNWISFHQNLGPESGEVLNINIYPMFAVNRRKEKNLRGAIIASLQSQLGMRVEVSNDYSSFEGAGRFLEGTGCLILDRVHAVAYCAQSPRAHPELLERFCADMAYTPVLFTAYHTVQQQRLPIYHTNVMMCVADSFAVICLDSIDDPVERAAVENSLKTTGKDIIAISEEQVGHFAGNMLQLETKKSGGDGDVQPVLVMSSEAFSCLTAQQRVQIEAHCPILHAPLPVIEVHGGGSARCMMAEVFF